MYTIRLELGRELEDYLFQQTRAREAARELEEIRKANSNGINNIINKPIETQLLLETIAKLVK